VRHSGSGLHESTGVSGRGVHPPGVLYRYQNRVFAAKGFRIDMKTKGVIFGGAAEEVTIEDAQESVRGKTSTGEGSFAIHNTFYHEGQATDCEDGVSVC